MVSDTQVNRRDAMERTVIDAAGLNFKKLNEAIRACNDDNILIKNCLGQRYIAAAGNGKNIRIEGVPGNALGAYLDSGVIEVCGNAQEAVGDTMNGGEIIIHGSCGDGAGYAMRGGRIMVRGDIGYRAGIHMKTYGARPPVLIVGGSAGSFLGEYQAGGIIIVLGLGRKDGMPPIHFFCGVGMYGGRIFLRCEHMPSVLVPEINAGWAEEEDLKLIEGHVSDFCDTFGYSCEDIMSGKFVMLKPTGINPYKGLYVVN